MDANKDNKISLEDFDDIFNSYGGAKMENDLWDQLLREADKNGDNVVSFDEFCDSMRSVMKQSLDKKSNHKQM